MKETKEVNARVFAAMLLKQGMPKENIQEIKPLFKHGFIPADHKVLVTVEDGKVIQVDNLPEDAEKVKSAWARQLAKHTARVEARQRTMERLDKV